MLTNAFTLLRSMALLPAVAGASLVVACDAPDRLEHTAQANTMSLNDGSGSDGSGSDGSGGGSGSGSDGSGSDGSGSDGSGGGSGSDVPDPPPLVDSFTFDGYAGLCRVATTYNYGDTSATGTVTITSYDSFNSVTMPFNGDESSFGFSFGAASGQYSNGQDYWSGDDTPNDQNYAWLAQCGDDYMPIATGGGSAAGFALMADCTNYRNRYTGSLANRDRAAGRANTDILLSIGSTALAMSPARVFRFGLMGARGTRIGLGATAAASGFMASGNQDNASAFAAAANAHCDGWTDCCAQPGGPHTACPAACRNNHGAGRGS